MVVETYEETFTAQAPSPKERKRHASDEPRAVVIEQKKPKASVTNNGWGELFKNRENFIEMHLC